MGKLKKCPICGNFGRLQTINDLRTDAPYIFYIVCKNNKCPFMTNWYRTLNEAVNEWNEKHGGSE